jgi:hypothetical protein
MIRPGTLDVGEPIRALHHLGLVLTDHRPEDAADSFVFSTVRTRT